MNLNAFRYGSAKAKSTRLLQKETNPAKKAQILMRLSNEVDLAFDDMYG
jgi:hypothetical protein